MSDDFTGHHAALDAPAADALAVTPDDGTDLPAPSRALYAGTGGALSLTMLSGSSVTFLNVPDGAILPVRVRRVRATGTTAGNIVALL